MIRITVQSEVYMYDMYHITKAFWPNEIYEQGVEQDFPKLIKISVGEHLEGSTEAFVKKMNQTAKDLGMKNTVFM